MVCSCTGQNAAILSAETKSSAISPGGRNFGSYGFVPQLCQFPGIGPGHRCGVVSVPNDELFGVQLEITVRRPAGASGGYRIGNLKPENQYPRIRSKSDNQSGTGIVEITVDISDVKHLQKVIHVLKAIRGIQDVERVHRIP